LTQENPKQFSDLGLIDPLLRAVTDLGYSEPTPIQQQAIPSLLEGRDLLGCAQTGTGKTAAFALPILHRLVKNPRRPEARQTRVLVLTPTRELAIQIHDSFKDYGKHLKLRCAVIFGGVGQGPQVSALAGGVDVLVATPGRLLDLINQKHLSLRTLDVFVLDEADRMLDMGFIHDIRKVIALLPEHRHNLFFSATMPPEIKKLADSMLKDPVQVEVTPVSSTAELIAQSVMFVDRNRKKDLLRHVLQDRAFSKVIVFTRTKHGANKVSEVLAKNNIVSEAIHGNKSQGARQRALENFRTGRTRVLVATDIAARGIDIDNITHVINFEVPNIAESYVHRIGRTARAGAEGIAISFCDAEERAFIRDIEKLIKQEIPVDREHPFHSPEVENARLMSKGKAKAAIEAAENKPRGGRRGNNRRAKAKAGEQSAQAAHQAASAPKNDAKQQKSHDSHARQARGPKEQRHEGQRREHRNHQPREQRDDGQRNEGRGQRQESGHKRNEGRGHNEARNSQARHGHSKPRAQEVGAGRPKHHAPKPAHASASKDEAATTKKKSGLFGWLRGK
jgi:ATP-dependent RNA helicase RhlE